jgi:hypothetical protein
MLESINKKCLLENNGIAFREIDPNSRRKNYHGDQGSHFGFSPGNNHFRNFGCKEVLVSKVKNGADF